MGTEKGTFFLPSPEYPGFSAASPPSAGDNRLRKAEDAAHDSDKSSR
jgi:hypothetical protein